MMVTQTFKYSDELVEFINDLLFMGVKQFQVAFHDADSEFAISYPAGVMPQEEDLVDE